MELKKLYLEQLNREAQASQKAVERVPEGHADWRPHPKSMELGKLASLSATMPGWIVLMIERDELNLDDPSSEKFRTKPASTRAELVDSLEKNVASAREALLATTEEHLMKPWSLVLGGRVLMEQPRHAAITDTFSHLAHHRGQLTVYLRLLNASVPAIYGPSADEN
ncbi:MAG: DinB family protein [Acidobacteriaceae bacterium]